LIRNGKAFKARSGSMTASKQLPDACHNLADANGPVENGDGGRQGEGLGPRSDQDGRNGLEQLLKRKVVGDSGRGLEDDHRGHSPRGESKGGVIRTFHPQCFDPQLAKIGAKRRPKRPVTRDYEYDWHPEIGV